MSKTIDSAEFLGVTENVTAFTNKKKQITFLFYAWPRVYEINEAGARDTLTDWMAEKLPDILRTWKQVTSYKASCEKDYIVSTIEYNAPNNSGWYTNRNVMSLYPATKDFNQFRFFVVSAIMDVYGDQAEMEKDFNLIKESLELTKFTEAERKSK